MRNMGDLNNIRKSIGKCVGKICWNNGVCSFPETRLTWKWTVPMVCRVLHMFCVILALVLTSMIVFGSLSKTNVEVGFHCFVCVSLCFIHDPKPYEFIGFGAMDGHLAQEFIGFRAMAGHLAYEFIGFGAMYGHLAQEFIGFRCL